MKKTLHHTKNMKSTIALLAFSLFFNYSWGQIDLSNYDLINTGDANDPVTIHSFSKEEVDGTTKNNAAANTLDKNNSTVWAADDGDVLANDYKGDGEYIIYDLGESQDVRLIQFTTTSKSDPFGYQVWISTTGTDADDFTKTLPASDDILLTKTNTTDFNQYEIQDGVNARYIKIIGYGRYNSDGNTRTSQWNAIGEIEFYEPGSGNGGGDNGDDDNGDGGDDNDSGPTNLVLNGTADDHTGDTNDNSDAWDMTPNSTIKSNDATPVDIDSPYRAIWNNSDLADWLAENCGDADEQPGSSSDGNWDYSAGADMGVKTRGVKINEACRRLYQVVSVTPGTEYTFSIESRSEAENVPSEVFILNTEITSEDGLTSTSDSVDHYQLIDNDFNASKSNATTNNFTTTTFNFTASESIVVLYVRASAAVDSSNEVFYDNIWLYASDDSGNGGDTASGEELVLNGTADEHTGDTNDNSDAWDMTPNSTIKSNDATPVDVDSPYRALWNNSDLADWLAENCGDADEQPGSSSDGNWDYSAGADMGVKTRGVKINEACRRLYQVVSVTPNTEYTFSIESRSEAENVSSEVFMLNTEITSEDGLSSTSSTVDHYQLIDNDFNASKSNATTNNFTTTTFNFTATTDKIVIYVRAPLAVDSSNEVFYDNISLKAAATASINDVFASSLKIYPNPATQFVNFSSELEINKVDVYSLLGKRVLSTSKLINNSLNVSDLSSGLYLMKITSGNAVASKRLIIK